MPRCESTHTIDWGNNPTVQCVMRSGHTDDHEGYPFPGDDFMIVYWDDSQQN